MKSSTVIIIGAGQAGLAMSRHLTCRSVDHVLLERGEVANSWRTERWDSLRLLTPNWQSRLPGYAYAGPDPDGYRTMPETVDFLSGYAAQISAPVETGTTVLDVQQTETGYFVRTDRGDWQCCCLVIASGACNIASKPRAAADLTGVNSITPMDYRNPDQLERGGVLIVGASATGVQLAREIQRSGRQVTLAVGEHVRVPRTYRGRDIEYWMDITGIHTTGLNEVDDIGRVRDLPSMQLIGTPERQSIDLNALQSEGVRVAGRVMDAAGSKVRFSGALANICMLADLKMNRLLSTVDAWIDQYGYTACGPREARAAPTALPAEPLLEADLKADGIRTVLWATGYKPDYSWLSVPVLDRKGRLRHTGGVVDAPGMYVLGLPFLRKRNSTLIDGVGEDARVLSDHLYSHLNAAAAAA
ncbi:MAG: NAD(P)-binding domain-containing protein [Hyphomonadaceae bacterium]|nr:NAD(P)-binding domain-containing protein [Hyphomonadaceae bacterium]